MKPLSMPLFSGRRRLPQQWSMTAVRPATTSSRPSTSSLDASKPPGILSPPRQHLHMDMWISVAAATAITIGAPPSSSFTSTTDELSLDFSGEIHPIDFDEPPSLCPSRSPGWRNLLNLSLRSSFPPRHHRPQTLTADQLCLPLWQQVRRASIPNEILLSFPVSLTPLLPSGALSALDPRPETPPIIVVQPPTHSLIEEGDNQRDCVLTCGRWRWVGSFDVVWIITWGESSLSYSQLFSLRLPYSLGLSVDSRGRGRPLDHQVGLHRMHVGQEYAGFVIVNIVGGV